MKILEKIKKIKFKKLDWNAILMAIKNLGHLIVRMGAFFFLLFVFIFRKISGWLEKLPGVGAFWRLFQEKTKKISQPIGKKLAVLIDKIDLSLNREKTRRSFLIQLAYSNLMFKKSRTLMTILGMSIGIGAIVFLLSLGYGIERLVINQVATLEEMKIIDVSAGENTSLRLNRQIYDKIKEYKEVKEIIPIISVVGKLTYNKATTDIIVYSVPKKYFDFSRFKLIQGNYFTESGGVEQSQINPPDLEGKVAGVASKVEEGEYLAKIVEEPVSFNILPGEKVKVFAECRISSEMLGYTVRTPGGYQGSYLYGGSFYSEKPGPVIFDKKRNMYLGRWLKGYFPLHYLDINDNLVQDLGDGGRQVWKEGCIPERDLEIEAPLKLGKVLGEATESASLSEEATPSGSSAIAFETVSMATSSASGIEIVTIQATDSAKSKTQIIEFKSPVSGEAVVSSGLLNLLGISKDKARETEFDLSFVLVKNLMPEIEGKANTTEIAYKIIGVIEDDNSSYLYIPFTDLYNQSISNFSQIKVVLGKKEDVPKIRKEIETIGFKTSSVMDTVSQIESLFATIRLVLSLLGFVALAVASLGMFNTLTVSLLERIREIGGMKVMGVVAQEIEDLFLAEAMIMGIAGGFGGLVIGFLGGKLVSLIFSLIAFAKQGVFLNLTYIPPSLLAFIVLLSFSVGIITGIYPAQRAKRISALNALRYE